MGWTCPVPGSSGPWQAPSQDKASMGNFPGRAEVLGNSNRVVRPKTNCDINENSASLMRSFFLWIQVIQIIQIWRSN